MDLQYLDQFHQLQQKQMFRSKQKIADCYQIIDTLFIVFYTYHVSCSITGIRHKVSVVVFSGPG